MSDIGQVIHYVNARPVIAELRPELKMTSEQIEKLADHMAEFSISALRRLLRVGKERTIESSRGSFTVIGEGVASKIAFLCSNMWKPYRKVIRENCSEALHILDRFHIVAKMNKALDEVRAEESRRMAREG